jgi:hypothetical protein
MKPQLVQSDYAGRRERDGKKAIFLARAEEATRHSNYFIEVKQQSEKKTLKRTRRVASLK